MLHRIRPAIAILGLSALLAAACGKDDPAPAAPSDGSGGAGGAGGSPEGSGGSGAPGATGGSGGSPDGGTAYDTPPIPAMIGVNEAPAAFASLLCEKVYTCCPVADQMRLPVTGQANCESTFTNLLTGQAQQVSAGMAANRVTFDGNALGSCLREYQAASCAAARPKGTVITHRECAFLTPLVELGQPCEQSFECKGGYCASGACVADKADGQPCTTDDECRVRCSPQAPRTCVPTPPVDLCAGL
jgi:hypothetical protein